jgi:hypothetical protein
LCLRHWLETTEVAFAYLVSSFLEDLSHHSSASTTSPSTTCLAAHDTHVHCTHHGLRSRSSCQQADCLRNFDCVSVATFMVGQDFAIVQIRRLYLDLYVHGACRCCVVVVSGLLIKPFFCEAECCRGLNRCASDKRISKLWLHIVCAKRPAVRCTCKGGSVAHTRSSQTGVAPCPLLDTLLPRRCICVRGLEFLRFESPLAIHMRTTVAEEAEKGMKASLV